MTGDRLEIDGADAGGQIVRSALALAALTDTSIKLVNVRGGRDPPGLRPQHIAAVRAVASTCDADVANVERGSEWCTFDPGTLSGGDYTCAIGTAGSVMLVFDAVLPLAPALDEPLSLTVSGGTEVKWAPPTATYRSVKLPLLRQFGWNAMIERHRPGFYPAGGGSATLYTAPTTPRRIELRCRGDRMGAWIDTVVAVDLEDAEVAERLVQAAATELEDAGIDVFERSITYTQSDSPGAVVSIRLEYENTRAGFDALGERGIPAEAVAEQATSSVMEFLSDEAPVDRHLADQLVLPVALSGGLVAIPEVTDHVSASLDLLEVFGIEAHIDRSGPTPVLEAPGHAEYRFDSSGTRQ